MQKSFVIAAAAIALLGVGLGAFGAHGLEATLTANGRADTFDTATQYQMYHALALIAVAWLSSRGDVNQRLLRPVGLFFIAGIALFSGSLYILAIFDLGLMGAIAPFGGASFLAGWGLLAAAVWRGAEAPT